MSKEKLLDIEPQALKFRYELNMQAFCTLKLSNNSSNCVAFKFMTTNPEKYFVRPNVGVLLPSSICDVEVSMLGPKEAPSDLHCRDEFLIKSIVASPGTTKEGAKKLFSQRGHVIEACRLSVVYYYPPLCESSNSERSPAGGSTLDDFQATQQGRNWFQFSDWFMKGITVGLLAVFFWYLMSPFIWSFALTILVLAMKVANKLVSDSVKEWAVRILAPVFIHFFTALYRRRNSTGPP